MHLILLLPISGYPYATLYTGLSHTPFVPYGLLNFCYLLLLRAIACSCIIIYHIFKEFLHIGLPSYEVEFSWVASVPSSL